MRRGLANTAWAFATEGWRDALLFAALARTAERCLDDLSAQGLANTAWAFATKGWRDAPLFAALARTAKRHLGDLNAQGLRLAITGRLRRRAGEMRRCFAALALGCLEPSYVFDDTT